VSAGAVAAFANLDPDNIAGRAARARPADKVTTR
jgi:hypothetical protein